VPGALADLGQDAPRPSEEVADEDEGGHAGKLELREAVTAQTPAERQEARRKRLLMEGLTEVRGIFLRPDQHAELKEYARKLAKHRSRKSPAERQE
jgi:hypothetical protein